MKITIDIPREFEVDVFEKGVFGENNKFVEFFRRVESAIKCHNLPTCGRYEQETAEMFAKAFDKLMVEESKGEN